ncbi:MAG: hypothetical protein R3F37_13630 [Candidatus Competibacteraceae bacterium]
MALVEALCPAEVPEDEPGGAGCAAGQRCGAEMGIQRVERKNAKLLDRVRQRLTALLETGKLDPQSARRRARAGANWETRVFIRNCFICLVAIMGRWIWDWGLFEYRRVLLADEAQLEMPYAYWMARYPVTVAQFGVFVKDHGYAGGALVA